MFYVTSIRFLPNLTQQRSCPALGQLFACIRIGHMITVARHPLTRHSLTPACILPQTGCFPKQNSVVLNNFSGPTGQKSRLQVDRATGGDGLPEGGKRPCYSVSKVSSCQTSSAESSQGSYADNGLAHRYAETIRSIIANNYEVPSRALARLLAQGDRKSAFPTELAESSRLGLTFPEPFMV